MKQPLKFRLLAQIGKLGNKEIQNKYLDCSIKELKKLIRILRTLR